MDLSDLFWQLALLFFLLSFSSWLGEITIHASHHHVSGTLAGNVNHARFHLHVPDTFAGNVNLTYPPPPPFVRLDLVIDAALSLGEQGAAVLSRGRKRGVFRHPGRLRSNHGNVSGPGEVDKHLSML